MSDVKKGLKSVVSPIAELTTKAAGKAGQVAGLLPSGELPDLKTNEEGLTPRMTESQRLNKLLFSTAMGKQGELVEKVGGRGGIFGS